MVDITFWATDNVIWVYAIGKWDCKQIFNKKKKYFGDEKHVGGNVSSF